MFFERVGAKGFLLCVLWLQLVYNDENGGETNKARFSSLRALDFFGTNVNE